MSDTTFTHPTILALRDQALSLPGVTEGDSCVKRSFKAGKKSFLFLGEKPDSFNMMFKLHGLAGAARESAGLEARPPEEKPSWVTLSFPRDQSPDADLMSRLVDESYRLQAPKKLLAGIGDPERRGRQ